MTDEQILLARLTAILIAPNWINPYRKGEVGDLEKHAFEMAKRIIAMTKTYSC